MIAATIVTMKAMKATMSVLQQQQCQVNLISTICVSDVVDLTVSKHFANNVKLNPFFLTADLKAVISVL